MKPSALLMAGIAAATLMSAPVYAAKVVVSDDTLDSIYGEANSTIVYGDSNSTVSATNANGNIQVNSFQWDDNHAADQSVNKGANNQAGDLSQVQQNVSAMANVLGWGTVAQSVTNNTADIGNDQTSEAWAVMFIGGF